MPSQYDQLLKYMTAVKMLEQERYTLENTISKLKRKYNQMGQKKDVRVHMDDEHQTDALKGALPYAFGIGIGAIPIIAFMILFHNFVNCAYGRRISYKWSLIIPAIIFAIIFLIGLLIDGIRNLKAKSYNSGQKVILSEKRRDDDNRVSRELAAKPKLRADITLLESDRKRVEDTLTELYSLGILPSKYYWDFVAVTEMHEYLKDGQTYTLRRNGSDEGAIKIYEDRLQNRQIIGLLHDVLDSLDEIKANQYSLYSAIQASNRRISSLESSVSKSLARIQQSQDVANYHASITSQCVAEMRDLQYYRMLLG